MDPLNSKLCLLRPSVVLAPPVIPASPAKEDMSQNPAEWTAATAPSHGWQKQFEKHSRGVPVYIHSVVSETPHRSARERGGEQRPYVRQGW